MMRKFALLALLAAALAVPSIAAAATPQGHLTGSANLNGGALFTVDVTDGGTSSVGLENDRSGNCDGDSGTVTLGVSTESVLCAHFVASSRGLNTGSPKMRFAIQNTGTDFYAVFRITDNGASTDTVAVGATDSLAAAEAWVNMGAIGSGAGGAWQFATLTSGNYTITP
jgi:hypothetical protein